MPNKTTKPIPQVFAQRTSPAPASRKLRINSLRSSRASIVFFEIQTDLALVRRAEKLFQPQKYSSPALPWFGLLSVQFFLCAFLGHENGALSHGKKTERHTAHTQSSNFQTVLHRDVISSVLHLAIFCDFSGKRYKCTRGGKIQKKQKGKTMYTLSSLFMSLLSSILPKQKHCLGDLGRLVRSQVALLVLRGRGKFLRLLGVLAGKTRRETQEV